MMYIDNTRKVVEMEGGSKLYGLATEQSDTDIWGVYVPSLEDALLDNVKGISSFTTGNKHEKNTSEDVDYLYYTFTTFVRQGFSGDTKVLDMLFASKEQLVQGPYFWVYEEIIKDRLKFFSKNNGPHLKYVMHQASKYGIKGSRYATVVSVLEALEPYSHDNGVKLGEVWAILPMGDRHISVIEREVNDKMVNFYRVLGKDYQENIKVSEFVRLMRRIERGYSDRVKQAKKNENVDWKALSHALRMSYQLAHIYKDGGFDYPLPESKHILAVKQGKVSFQDVSAELEEVVDTVTSLAVNSDFPDEVDSEFWEDKLHQITREILEGQKISAL